MIDLSRPAALPAPRDPQRWGIGVIGAGFIMDDCHLVAYRQAGFRPVGITSRTRSRAEDVAQRRAIPQVHDTPEQLAADPDVHVVDVAVPPDHQADVILRVLNAKSGNLKGILAQKPLGVNLAEAVRIVEACANAGVELAVNQNMRYDPAVRTAAALIRQDAIGQPVLASVEMRAVPHWMPWQQRQGWVTLRIMSIHHLDTFRLWFGNPQRVFASVRPDPRTARQFDHSDGIAISILEYADGLRATSLDDVWAGPIHEGAAGEASIRWRIEGTQGLMDGTVGWPRYPEREPSRLAVATLQAPGVRSESTWPDVWFPDAFAGPMGELLSALEDQRPPSIQGRDNLVTMAVVEACYQAAAQHRAIALDELLPADMLARPNT